MSGCNQNCNQGRQCTCAPVKSDKNEHGAVVRFYKKINECARKIAAQKTIKDVQNER